MLTISIFDVIPTVTHQILFQIFIEWIILFIYTSAVNIPRKRNFSTLRLQPAPKQSKMNMKKLSREIIVLRDVRERTQLN
jgi:hypothetical protein